MSTPGSSFSSPSAGPNPLYLRCQKCGRHGPVLLVSLRQNIGMLYSRSTKIIDAELCKSCIRKYALRFTGVTLILGWWGMFSMFLTPIYIGMNIVEYFRTFFMQDIPE